MKRLVDESTDELTRSLLAAGIEHRPPQGNKATVIVALGAGGALGLFSSNALAWLGTTAGKVTAVGAAVGIAGAVFVAVPALRGDSGDRAHATAASRGATSIANAPANADRGTGVSEERVGSGAAGAVAPGSEAPSRAASLTPPGAGEPASALDEPSNEPLGALPFGGQTNGTSEEANAQRAVAGGSGAAEGRLEAAAGERKSARSSARSTSKKRHLGRTSRTRKLAASERAEAQASEAAAASNREAAVARTSAEKDRLDAEVRLIDDMHWAARHNDRAALARSVQTYRETFPDGQLKAEAAEFAARLERSDAP